MVNIGGIVSVGGGAGGSSSSSGSGIQSINSQSGPTILVNGVNGASIIAGGNVITVNVASLSGLIAINGSGLNAINGDRGPNIDLIGVSGIQVVPQGNGRIHIGTSGTFLTSQSGVVGVNGITVSQVGGNFVIDGSSISGVSATKFAASFVSTTSGVFTHNLNTLDIIVQIYDDQVPRRWLLPDEIVVDDVNRVSVLFNRPQSGRIVVI